MSSDVRYNSAEYLVGRFLDDIVRLSLVYVRNFDDAQDIAQQVFVTYLQKKPVFISEEHARNWLFKVAVNASKNFKRAQRGELSYDELAGVLADRTNRENEMSEMENKVVAAVMRLKRIYREVIHLYYYCGYNSSEISKILEIPDVSVRSRLSRARAALKKEMTGGERNEK